MTGLIPFYLKTVYKKEPVFAHSKVVYTIGQNTFKENSVLILQKRPIYTPRSKKRNWNLLVMPPIRPCSAGATYAMPSFGAEKTDKKLIEEFSKVRGKKVLPYNTESDLSDYLQLYTDLTQ